MVREVEDSAKTKGVRPLARQRKLIPSDIKWCDIGADGCLNFEKTFLPGYIERKDIVTCAVAQFLGDPSNLLCQVWSIQLVEPLPFVMEDKLLTIAAKPTIAEISLNGIKF